jgi:hypothetical protein
MPHPGPKVAGNKNFDGKWSDIDPNCLKYMKEFIPRVLSPKTLILKRILGKVATGQMVFDKLEEYRDVMNSDGMPDPKTMYEVLAEGQLTDLIEEILKAYKKEMNEKSKIVRNIVDLKNFHTSTLKNSQLHFKQASKIGKSKKQDKFLKSLEQQINAFYENLELMVKQVIMSEEFERKAREAKASIEQLRRERQQYEEDMQRRLAEMESKNKNLEKEINKPSLLGRVGYTILGAGGAIDTAVTYPFRWIPGVDRLNDAFAEGTSHAFKTAFNKFHVYSYKISINKNL